MASSNTTKAGAKTRYQSSFKLRDLVGPGKEFFPSEVPTLRAAVQRGVLIKEICMIEKDASKKYSSWRHCKGSCAPHSGPVAKSKCKI